MDHNSPGQTPPMVGWVREVIHKKNNEILQGLRVAQAAVTKRWP